MTATAAAVGAAFLAIVWSWWRERRCLPPVLRWFSLAARLSALALVAAGLLDVDVVTLLRRPRPIVVVAADVSGSMELADDGVRTRRSRMDSVAASVARRSGIRVERLDFGDASSDLGRAIADAARRGPDALVLLSDGNHNAGPDPINAAAAAGIPVNAVGFGPAEAGPNPVISLVVHPDQVEVGERFTVRATARGGTGRLRWSLSEDGRELAVTEAAPEALTAVLSASTRVPGLHRYQLRLTGSNGRGDAAGLTMLASHSRIDLAWLELAPGWNLRFAAQALAADPAVRLRCFARLGARLVRADGAVTVPADSLAGCDVLVLSGGRGEALPPELERLAERSVLANGGGVLIIGDVPSPIAPLRCVPQGAQPQPGEVSLDPGWRQIGLASAADSSWGAVVRRGPPMAPRAVCEPSDSSVTVLASARTPQGARLPLWAVRYAGGGRVAQFASNDLWKWKLGLSGVLADTAHFDQLVVGLVRWLSGREQQGLRSGTDRSVYTTGERPALRGFWQGWDGSTAAGSRWSAVVSGPSGYRRTVVMDDWGRGDYGADLAPLAPGAYSFRTVLMVRGRPLHRGQGRFFVEAARAESAGTTQNRELLREVAAVSGGRYCDADSLPPDGSFPGPVRTRNDRPPAHERLLVVVLAAAALLAAEWAVRRRHGLR